MKLEKFVNLSQAMILKGQNQREVLEKNFFKARILSIAFGFSRQRYDLRR
jgi:hypothetical protein